MIRKARTAARLVSCSLINVPRAHRDLSWDVLYGSMILSDVGINPTSYMLCHVLLSWYFGDSRLFQSEPVATAKRSFTSF